MPRLRHAIPAMSVLLALLILAASNQGGEKPSLDGEKRVALLKRLRERAANPREDVDPLWDDLVTFRRSCAGTDEAFEAAVIMSKVRSPLDKLKASDIPKEDRFHWQPQGLVGVVGEHRGRHWGPVRGVAFSADGKQVISAAEGVRVWDRATMIELRWFNGSFEGMSPDQTRLVGVSPDDGHLCVWDASRTPPKDCGILRKQDSGRSFFGAFTWSLDGSTFAAVESAGKNRAILLWDVKDGLFRQGNRTASRLIFR